MARVAGRRRARRRSGHHQQHRRHRDEFRASLGDEQAGARSPSADSGQSARPTDARPRRPASSHCRLIVAPVDGRRSPRPAPGGARSSSPSAPSRPDERRGDHEVGGEERPAAAGQPAAADPTRGHSSPGSRRAGDKLSGCRVARPPAGPIGRGPGSGASRAAAGVLASRAGRCRHDGRRGARGQRRPLGVGSGRRRRWRSPPVSSRWGGATTTSTASVTRPPDGPTSPSPAATSRRSWSAGPPVSRWSPSCRSRCCRAGGRRWCTCAAVALAWAYDLGLKSTAWSVVPYTIAFGLLPVFVVLGLPGAPLPPWWAPLAGALLGAGCAFREHAAGSRRRPGDRRAGPAPPARGTRVADPVGDAAAGRVGGARIRPWAAATRRLRRRSSCWRSWLPVALVAIGSVLGRRPGSRAPFRATMLVALVDVVLLVARGRALV